MNDDSNESQLIRDLKLANGLPDDTPMPEVIRREALKLAIVDPAHRAHYIRDMENRAAAYDTKSNLRVQSQNFRLTQTLKDGRSSFEGGWQMNAVLNEIQRQRRAEELAAWTKNENAMAEKLAATLQTESTIRGVPGAIAEAQSQPNPVEQALWESFMQWANERQVRYLPARPSTCAMFLYERGVPHETALDALRVIARMHDKFQMPSPVACASLRAILELSMDEKPPRSWKRDEQEQWAYLPAEIRFALSRRQRDFDKEIRRCQNETADLRKKVNAEKQEQIIKSLERPVEQDHSTSP